MTDSPTSLRARGLLESVEFLLWLLLFAATPQIVVLHAYDSFLLPKILWAETLIVALAGLALVLTLLGRPFILPLSPVLGVLGLYALWHAASVAWALSPSIAADNAQLWLLMAVAAVLMPSACFRREGRLKTLGLAMLASVAVTAIWVLVQDWRQAFAPQSVTVVNKLGDWRGFLAAGFGNTSHIGDFLAIAYPFAFLLYLASRRTGTRAVLLVWLMLVYAGLIAAFSVHSNTGLILAMLVTVGGLWKASVRRGEACLARGAQDEDSGQGGRGMPRPYALSLLLLGWVLIGLFFALDVPGNPHSPGIFHEAFGSARLAFGWGSRVFIWLTGLDIAQHHRWLGVGSGNFTFAFPEAHSAFALADEQMRWEVGVWTNAAHNELLQAWAELGIVGPVLLIALFVLAFRALGRGLSREKGIIWLARMAALAALVCYAVDAQMNFPLQTAHSMVLLVLLVDLAAMLPLWTESEDRLVLRLEEGWGVLRVEIENGRIPRLLDMQLHARPIAALVVGLLIACPTITLQTRASLDKERSDIAYRRAHEWNAQWQKALKGGEDPAALQSLARQIDDGFQAALKLWPQHHNARSEYSEFLVCTERGAEAIPQIKQTLERLHAWELYLRLARAQWEAGQTQNARKNLARALAIRPVEAVRRPNLAAWAWGAIPAEKALPPHANEPTEEWGKEAR